jgi:hypothetical protein
MMMIPASQKIEERGESNRPAMEDALGLLAIDSVAIQKLSVLILVEGPNHSEDSIEATQFHASVNDN